MVRLPEDLRVLQIPRERPIRYIVTNMVKEQEPPQPALKILERLLLQLRSIVINTGSVRVQVPLGKLAIPPLQPIRISMEESKSEEKQSEEVVFMNKSSRQSLSQLFFNPSHQYRNGVLLLFFCQ